MSQVDSPAPITPATNGAATPSDEYKDVVLPPPEIRSIVDKTAAFVAKNPNPETFEEKIRAREKSDSRFAFLNKTDAYHAYYQLRLDAFRKGAVLESKDAKTGANGAAGAQAEDDKEDKGPPKPPTLEFLVEEPPVMNAVDLDILRLTALFTARSGRRFTSELASRESRNYQFDFLRPSHSLFGYFNRLTEQYTKILIPSKEFQTSLDRHAGGPPNIPDDERVIEARREIKKDADERVEYEKWETSRRQELEDEQEAERIAFAEIDWKDFIVVSTVEFTEADEAGLVELPPPMSLSEVENMTLAQKKMASMIMEGREDELDEIEKERMQGEEAEMEMDDASDDEQTAQITATDKERLKVVEIIPATSEGPMKIRKDYIPKAKREKKAEQAVTTFGGQQVPVDEFADHVRYELLDPKWRETKRQNEANRSAANLLPEGTDVSASLRAMASHRSDIFGTADNAEIKRQQEAQKAQSRAREAEVWDGHAASRETIQGRYQSSANVNEQIEALHRAKGLLAEDDSANKIGPSVPVAPTAVEAPSPFIAAGTMSGATFSAAPQPNQQSSTTSYPAGYGYAQYPNQQPQGAYGVDPNLPARPPVANPGESMLGQTRAAEDALEGEPDAKRMRAVPKLPEGQYYPEEEWLEAHPDPITIKVVLPTYPAKPEWGCDGKTIDLVEVPLTLLIGSLRDRITIKTGLPIGKQKLMFRGRPLANNTTLGGLNFDDGHEITVDIKEGKKK